ncbi:hypothetical protein HYPSUDRAFT_54369 [Hypholoma sublateritium FD-334 SS-4]|uniref:Uncharacterized protein n=1 Tax=Hypholoma sublateritium (strain FD-334 SS-4) TaxID=945553 RepID=A0A0D2L884_HYPSF|nr:hypothetical protein HYPSUDRAFT_54369 [Hypholoma sublateritium FD-334 SS-4]
MFTEINNMIHLFNRLSAPAAGPRPRCVARIRTHIKYTRCTPHTSPHIASFVKDAHGPCAAAQPALVGPLVGIRAKRVAAHLCAQSIFDFVVRGQGQIPIGRNHLRSVVSGAPDYAGVTDMRHDVHTGGVVVREMRAGYKAANAMCSPGDARSTTGEADTASVQATTMLVWAPSLHLSRLTLLPERVRRTAVFQIPEYHVFTEPGRFASTSHQHPLEARAYTDT